MANLVVVRVTSYPQQSRRKTMVAAQSLGWRKKRRNESFPLLRQCHVFHIACAAPPQRLVWAPGATPVNQ